jgi:hypothetical protein
MAGTAEAQRDPEQTRGWEFVIPSGILLPTGEQREDIKRSNLTAVQLSYRVRPPLILTTMVGWARSRDVASSGQPKLDVFLFDLGAEVRGPRWFADHPVTVSPFAGAGAGTRSYNHRTLDVDATHNLAAYASAGGEIAYRRVRLRLEARDYLTGFRPLQGEGAADTRNDVALLFGLRLVMP